MTTKTITNFLPQVIDQASGTIPPNDRLGDQPDSDPKIPPRRVLGDLDTSWHPRVAEAVSMARKWQARRRRQSETQQVSPWQKVNASMVLLATKVDGDSSRTGYGCGKTHVALAALWSICYMLDNEPIAPAGRFFVAADLITNLDGDTPIRAEIGDSPIVVIDDVGAEGQIKYIGAGQQEGERHSRYFRLINHCYENNVSMIITANLTADGLAQHIGGRAWSRLLEMAPTGFMLDMTGVPDYRRRTGGR